MVALWGETRLTAEIVSIGTELLLGQIVDTNAAYLSQTLASLGINVYFRSTVGDNLERIIETIRSAMERADLIITSGGLGPTMDDLTKEAIAKAFGVPLVEHPESAEALRAFFRSRNQPFAESNLKQALVFEGGMVLPNPMGTAPGAAIEKGGKIAVCLPGPPRELVPMVQNHLVPFLRQRLGAGGTVLRSRVVATVGISESLAEQKVADLLAETNPTVAPVLHGYEVHFRITASGTDEQEVDALLARKERELRDRLGDYVYGVGDGTLEAVLVRALIGRGWTIAVAESCTGGLVGHRITNVPGSSKAFLCGITAYANEAKVSLLGVQQEALRQHGAVSSQVACQMADGVRRASGASVGVAITGIAGPDGGTPEKPVGLVYIAVATDGGTRASEHRFVGTREDIKQRSAQAALDAARRAVLGANP